MKLKQELITPKMAQEFLDNQVEYQRRLKPSSVAFLANEMKRGAYKETSETIKIGPDGRMFDGQNRCTAIVKSGKPQMLAVSRDEDPSNYVVIDKGVVRSDADSTRLVPLLVALIKRYHRLVMGGFVGQCRKLSPDQILDIYFAHQEAFDFAHCNRCADKLLGNVAIWAAFVEYYEKNSAKAEEFVRAFKRPVSDIRQAGTLRDAILRDIPEDGTALNFYQKAVFCANAHLHNKEVMRVFKGKWTN